MASNQSETAIALRAVVELEFSRQLDSSVLNTMAYQSAFAVLRTIRERTMAGIDADGKRFSPYTRAYLERKKKLVKENKSGNQWMATKTPAWMRLSGRVFNDMYVKSARGKLTKNGLLQINAELDFRTPRSKEIASYQKRNFWNVSKAGTAYGRREIRAIEDAINEVLDSI